MQLYTFEADGGVDIVKFEADWEIQRNLNGWPPFDFRWDDNVLRAIVGSDNVREAELRKILNFSLGPQGRRLKEP